MMLRMIMSQAQYFSAKLSKDIKRGNAKKREKGGTTTMAPMGYINNPITKMIEPDPERFELVRKAFDLMLSGEYSIAEIAHEMNDKWGFRLIRRGRIGGTPVSAQGLHKTFRSKLYAGIIVDPHTGQEYVAKHQPMITAEEYEEVQQIMSGKGKNRRPNTKHFAYKGLLVCGECGCSITAEHKWKHRCDGSIKHYVLYHCTHKSKKHKCKQGAIQESSIESQLKSIMTSYELNPKLREWSMRAIEEIAQHEAITLNKQDTTRSNTIEEIEKQKDKLLDYLTSGIIDPEEYKSKKLRLDEEVTKLKSAKDESDNKTKNWQEIIGKAIVHLGICSDVIGATPLEEKRGIMASLGSNAQLIDKKVVIEPHFWLKPILDNKEKITEELEKVRTDNLQIKNASNEAIYQKWWSTGDSNSSPLPCHGSALPNELVPQHKISIA